jgi:hypothetical protein
MNEGICTDERVEVIANDSYRIIIGKATPTSPAYPIGVAWHDGVNWNATHGHCWVGSYKNWDEALGNIIVAYFG